MGAEPFELAMRHRARAEFHLILLAGESNMATRLDGDHTSQPAHPRVFMLNREDEWVFAAGEGVGAAFGVELAERDTAIVVGLIPCALKGSSIQTWEPGGVHEPTGVHPYDEAIRRTRRALRDGRLAAILWHQGESDSDADLAADYDKRLHGLIQRFRTEFKDPRLPFVVGQMGRFQDHPWNQARIWVDAAHRNLPRYSNWTAFVPSNGLSHTGDGAQFDKASLEKLGQRYAMSYFPLRRALVATQVPQPIPRRIPAKGLSMPPERQTRLERRLAKEQTLLDEYRSHPQYADAAIYLKAVQWALLHDEFYRSADFDLAEEMLLFGSKRREQLTERRTPWRPTTDDAGPRGLWYEDLSPELTGHPNPTVWKSQKSWISPSRYH